jgi:hypothetical protein
MRTTLKTSEILARLQEKLKAGTSTKRERLVAILGRLGSDQDGEVTVAARMAIKMLNEMGLTWDYVIRQAGDADGSNASNTELLWTKQELALTRGALDSSRKDRQRLEGDLIDWQRRVIRAEREVVKLKEDLEQAWKSGTRTPEETEEAWLQNRARFFYGDSFRPKNEMKFDIPGTTSTSPGAMHWEEEIKSMWAKRPTSGENQEKKSVYSYNDKEVTDMLWTADATQAAKYCLRSMVSWTYEETTFLGERVNALVISGEELARLKIMFAKARSTTNQGRSGATA